MFRPGTAAVRFVAAVGLVSVVAGASGAHADELSADGDGATPIAANPLAFGSDVCTDTEVTKAFAMAVKRDGNGNGNSFKNGSTVTLSIVSAPTGITATLPTAPGNQITLPSNWESQPNGQQSTANALSNAVIGSAKLRLATARTYVGWNSSTNTGDRVLLRASGTAINNNAITRDVSLSVTGAVSSCTPTDGTAPVLSLPTSFTAEATSAAGAQVTYNASATDAIDGSVATSCTPASGTTFALGATTVNCSASDAAGNRATGSFTVTVADRTRPVLVGVPGDFTVEADSVAGTRVNYDAPTANDALGAPAVSCLPASGTVFPIRATEVTCSASDAAGNTGSGQFTVTVADTQGPVIGDITAAELVASASSAAGATVNYTAPAATDAVTGNAVISCTPTSGSTFALGETPIECAATDGNGIRSTKNFTMVVRDTTAPVLVVPEDMTQEATDADGALISYRATATDNVDGSITPSCAPPAGTRVALNGSVTVNCSVSDAAGNGPVADSFTVTVRDTRAPELGPVSDLAEQTEATSATGASVTFTAPTATDAVDPNAPVVCKAGTSTVRSGDTFGIGTTVVSCTATDESGNTSAASTFDVVVADTTAPALTNVPASFTVEAESADGALVRYTAPGATDAVDSSPLVRCSPASGTTFALGSTSVSCTATDAAGNPSQPSRFAVTVSDTTGPNLSLPTSTVIDAADVNGAVYSYTATASDLVDSSVTVTCQPASGSTFAIGTTTVSCTAADDAGNENGGDFTVTVRRTLTGFFQPVDTGRTLNAVKGGSTLPLKFEVFAGKTELTAIDIFQPLAVKQVSCETSAPVDDIEQLVSGGTSLRYDTTAGHYNWGWKTPTKAGACYMVTVKTLDGALKTAQFKLR